MNQNASRRPTKNIFKSIILLLIFLWNNNNNKNTSFFCGCVDAFVPVNNAQHHPSPYRKNEQYRQLQHQNKNRRHAPTTIASTSKTKLRLIPSFYQTDNNDIIIIASKTILQLLIQPLQQFSSDIASAYTNSLMEHPLVTKSITAGFSCGLGDYLAQQRSKNKNKINNNIVKIDWKRLARFSIKGLGGGVIWSIWYDTVDELVDSIMIGLSSASSLFADVSTNSNSNIAAYSSLFKVITSMVLEQFLWCPLVFGIWEIPLSTILNKGSISSSTLKSIPTEVENKLGGLLIDNAKVWTPANLIIYNIPLEYRTGVSNVFDVLWQSIVADMAASCGVVNKEEKQEPTVALLEDPSVVMVENFLNPNAAAITEDKGHLSLPTLENKKKEKTILLENEAS